MVWFITTLFVVYSFCLNTAAAVFAEAIKTSLSASDSEIAGAAGAFILGFAGMQIPAGYLLDRYNTRYIVSLGVLILALGNLLISFTHHLIFFALFNFLQGLGASFAFIAVGVLISKWFPQSVFPVLFGLTQTVSCIFAAAIHYWFVLMLNSMSWSLIYQQLSVFGFILLIMTFLVVKTPDNQNDQHDLPMSLKMSLGYVFKNKQILLAAVSASTSFGVLLAYASFWYLNIQQYYQINSLQSVTISGMVFVGIGIGTPLLGWLANRWHSRVMVLHLSLVLGAMFLLVGIYLPHFNLNTLIIIKIISFFIGFFLSGSMLYYTVVSENSINSVRGVALSVTNTTVFLFNAMMLFIPYWFITGVSKTFFTYLWILPLLVMFSILINFFVKETYVNS